MVVRLSAEERREAVLDAALVEFAECGYTGTSTENIARRAGISQPYLFRLFGTKKQLYIASVARCFRETLEAFQRAAEGLRGEEALHAIGAAYMEQLERDKVWLRAQMQAYAACDDPAVAAIVRGGFGDLVSYVERVSGLEVQEISRFFANGMLMNVLASMRAQDEAWGTQLLEGCKDGMEP
jgi:AcrR family transcriptional regulator